MVHTSANVVMLPGMYRVHFNTQPRDGEFYFDVEVKPKKENRAYVRAVGAPVQDGVKSKFIGKWAYADEIRIGGQVMFNGTVRLHHVISKVERLPAA